MSQSFITAQRRMAMGLLKAGKEKVWMNPEKMDLIKTAKSHADIKRLIQSGDIKRKWTKRELHPAVYDKIYGRRKSWPNPYLIKMIPYHLQFPPPLVGKDEEQRAQIEKQEQERIEKVRAFRATVKANKKIMPQGENYITRLVDHPLYQRAREELAHRAAREEVLPDEEEEVPITAAADKKKQPQKQQQQKQKFQQKQKPQQKTK